MDVNGLSVADYHGIVRGQPRAVPIRPDSPRFMLVAAAVRCGLDILNSPIGRRALEIQTEIFATDPVNRSIGQLRGLKESAYPELVRQFLMAVHQSFPRVLVSAINGMETANGRTSKLSTERPFKPQKCAVIEISTRLIEALEHAYARSRQTRPVDGALQNFQALLCRISITMAHELAHVYTLFLLQDRVGATPPRASYGSQVHETLGEAGRFMERNIFGGYVDMRRTKQGFFVAIRDAYGRYVWVMQAPLIERILARNLGWMQTCFIIDRDNDYYDRAVAPVRNGAHGWADRYDDFFPDEQNVIRNERQKLEETETRFLVNERLNRGYVANAALRALAVNPRSPLPAVQVRVY